MSADLLEGDETCILAIGCDWNFHCSTDDDFRCDLICVIEMSHGRILILLDVF